MISSFAPMKPGEEERVKAKIQHLLPKIKARLAGLGKPMPKPRKPTGPLLRKI